MLRLIFIIFFSIFFFSCDKAERKKILSTNLSYGMSYDETKTIFQKQSKDIIIKRDTISYNLFYCDDSLEGILFDTFDEKEMSLVISHLKKENVDYKKVVIQQLENPFVLFKPRIFIQSGRLKYIDSFAVSCKRNKDLQIW